ncbi:MAG: hypothetical protein KDC54_10200, partial [Lewinella sp.]|nr:hypothetical protein [Lewinella sp.]
MAAPDKVLMLIRSLSAAEKRYFHRHTQHHGRREPHYWQLYRFIEQWPGDDWPLATELPDFPFRDHVAVVKNQLYERLLDALHLYYLENQPEEQLKRWLHQAHLLLRRGQPDGARKRSQQARQWIEDQAAWTYWPELMELDRQIMEFTFREKDQGAALQAWQEDYRYGLEQLLSALPYAGLKARIAHQHLRRVSLPENELAAFRHEWSELPITEQPGAAADYYQAQALLAFMERQPMEARAANERLLSVLADQDPARHG